MDGGAATAFPSVSLYPKLSREAVEQRRLTLCELLPADYGTGEEEYYIPLPLERRVCAPQPLAAMFLLQPQPLSSGLASVPRLPGLVTARRLPEDETAGMLRRNLHAAWLIEKWMDGRRLDTLCRRLAAAVPCWALSYPKAFALLPEVARALSGCLEQP